MSDSTKMADYKNKGKTADACREARKEQMNIERTKAREKTIAKMRVKTTQTDYSAVIEMHTVLFNGKKYIDSFKYKQLLYPYMGHGCNNCLCYATIEETLIGLCSNCAYALAEQECEAPEESYNLYECDLYEDNSLIIPPYITEHEKYIITSYCRDNPFESRELPPLIPIDASF